MKKLLLIVPVLLALTGARPAILQVDPNGAVLTFESPAFNFDTIVQGTVISHDFKFTNTGKEPLIITKGIISCGCTTVNWPQEPILPRKSGSVNFTFNSIGKMGRQDRTSTIQSNSINGDQVIHLEGVVVLPVPNKN